VDVHLAAHCRAVAAEGQIDAAQLTPHPSQQHPLQFLQLLAGDEVPERAAEAAVGAVPAVGLGEGVEACVDLDQAVVIVDYVAESCLSDQLRLSA
jgi:hypothetical protein